MCALSGKERNKRETDRESERERKSGRDLVADRYDWWYVGSTGWNSRWYQGKPRLNQLEHTHTHTHFPFTVFDCFTLVLTVSHNKSNKQDTKDSQIYIQVPAVGGHSLIMCYFFTYMVITQAHTYNFPNRLVRILTLSTNWSFWTLMSLCKEWGHNDWSLREDKRGRQDEREKETKRKTDAGNERKRQA